MIDPHWIVEDLDPRTWRNLGRFIDLSQFVRTAQPNEHGLFVLHDDGHPLRVFDSRSGVRRDLGVQRVDDARLLAHSLFETGEWDRVHVIDRRHLAEVARRAQAIENRALTLDAYYHHVFELIWRNPTGYASVPPHPGDWHGWTYARLKHFIGELPPAATLALGVFDSDSLSIGLILEVHSGLITRLTTFEALGLPSSAMRLSADFLEQLWSRLQEKYAPPSAALLYTAAAFESWITAGDKDEFLRRALREGTALCRLAP